MTIHWSFAMRIKPTSTYENIWSYYIMIVVTLLHVSVTFCGHIQDGGVFRRIYYKDKQTNVELQNINF